MKSTLIILVLALPLGLSPAMADEMPKDLSSQADITLELEFWDGFITELKRDRDATGNVSLAQCINKAYVERQRCQQRVADGGGDGVGFERCYLIEDQAREWCFRAWDRPDP